MSGAEKDLFRFTIRIANRNIGIESIYGRMMMYSEQYLTDQPADFVVQSSPEEILSEGAEYRKVNPRGRVFKGEIESLLFLRKITERMLDYDTILMHGAVVAVNAVGDVYHPETGEVLGCAHMPDGTPVPAEGLLYGHAPAPQQIRIPAPGSNTTIGVVAVDCKLTKEQANRLADVAHDGLARTIRPVHTQMDGDTMFALGTGRTHSEVNFVKLCAAAAEVTARAIANALLFAKA